jgi:hypothetical protein
MKPNYFLLFILVFILFLFFFIFSSYYPAFVGASDTRNAFIVNNYNDSSEEFRAYLKFEDVNKRFLFFGVSKTSDEVKEEVLEEVGDALKHDFGEIISVNLNETEYERLAEKEGVKEIGVVPVKKLMLSDSLSIINATIVQKLQVNGINLTGKGQTICIIDSGINYNHASLGGCYGNNNASSSCKVIGGWDFVNNDANPMDDNGHGTHVAGIAAANGSVVGVAPEAKIIAIKSGDSSGTLTDDDVLAGINWCVGNSSVFNISVISMSFGGGSYNSSCDYMDDPFNITLAINNAIAKNISAVAATGNGYSVSNLSFPACLTNVTPVSATYKNDSIALYANTNNLVMLLAPGDSITSTSYNSGTEVKSGTSMATPAVSGAIAIINQYLAIIGLTKTPSQIEVILNNTGKRIQDTGYSNLNFSRIDIYSALLSLDVTSPNVSLSSPSNNFKIVNRSLNFSCVSYDFLLKNISFYIWNSSSLYYNETKNISGISNNTSFNLTNIAFNDYNWSCLVFDNKSNSFMASNYSVSIRRILTTLASPSNNSFTNINYSNFTCISETNNAFNLTNASFYLWNSSSLYYNETKNISGTSNSSLFNYSVSNEGIYYWNCFSFNNNSNSAFADANNSLTYDITSPNITLVSPNDAAGYSSNSQEIIFVYNVSDNFEIANCSLIINNAISLTNSSITNFSVNYNFTSSFSPASYSWKINCTDKAGNIGNSSSRSFSVSAPSNPPSSGGGGGGGGGEATSKTYSISSSQISSGYSQTLGGGDSVSFVIPAISSSSGEGGGSGSSGGSSSSVVGVGSSSNSGSHSISVNSISTSYVNITIRSNPINLLLYVGEEKKLNLSSSEYYDLYVKLNSIANNKANLTIKAINERIFSVQNFADNSTGNETSEENNLEKSKTLNANIYRVILTVVVILIILAVYYFMRNNKTKTTKNINLKKKK